MLEPKKKAWLVEANHAFISSVIYPFVTLAGALQAVTAVSNVIHAPDRVVSQVCWALLVAEVYALHAAFVAAATSRLDVAFAYAAVSAVARAEYAAFTAVEYVVYPPSMVASRAFTAAPTHAIFVCTVAAVAAVFVWAPAIRAVAKTAVEAISPTAIIVFFVI